MPRRFLFVRNRHETAAEVLGLAHRIEERADRAGAQIERNEDSVVAVLGEEPIEDARSHDLYDRTPDDGEQRCAAGGDETAVRVAIRLDFSNAANAVMTHLGRFEPAGLGERRRRASRLPGTGVRSPDG